MRSSEFARRTRDPRPEQLERRGDRFGADQPADDGAVHRRPLRRRSLSRKRFYPCYGLAESTVFVAGGPRTARPVIRAAVGPAPNSGKARAVPTTREDADAVPTWSDAGDRGSAQEDRSSTRNRGCRLADGSVGEIWVRGPSVRARLLEPTGVDRRNLPRATCGHRRGAVLCVLATSASFRTANCSSRGARKTSSSFAGVTSTRTTSRRPCRAATRELPRRVRCRAGGDARRSGPAGHRAGSGPPLPRGGEQSWLATSAKLWPNGTNCKFMMLCSWNLVASRRRRAGRFADRGCRAGLRERRGCGRGRGKPS